MSPIEPARQDQSSTSHLSGASEGLQVVHDASFKGRLRHSTGRRCQLCCTLQTQCHFCWPSVEALLTQPASTLPTHAGHRLSPRLQAVREEVVDGKYALALEFSSKKKEMTHQMWEDRREKFQTFFGPGVTASVSDTEQVG